MVETDNKAAGCAEVEENNVLHFGRRSDQETRGAARKGSRLDGAEEVRRCLG